MEQCLDSRDEPSPPYAIMSYSARDEPNGLCMLLNNHMRQSGNPNTPRASDGLQENKFCLSQEGEGTGTESIKATTCIQCVAVLSY
jgi:hypothetical protein